MKISNTEGDNLIKRYQGIHGEPLAYDMWLSPPDFVEACLWEGENKHRALVFCIGKPALTACAAALLQEGAHPPTRF